VPSFVEKYPKIKYSIFNRPHNLEMDRFETLNFSLTKKIRLTCKKNPNMCDRTKRIGHNQFFNHVR
jgi:hypothetical protein